MISDDRRFQNFFFITKKEYINKIKIRRIIKKIYIYINTDIILETNNLEFSYFVQIVYLFYSLLVLLFDWFL